MYSNLLLEKAKNKHYATKYVKFIESRTGTHCKYQTHRHHILPKAKDMWPEYKNLSINKWNSIHLTHREHFIAHMLLHKAFCGTSQSIAFFNMANIAGKVKSKAYAESKVIQTAAVIRMTQDPIRCAKISNAMKGKKKSPEHIAKMIGHVVTEATRQKLSNINKGKTHTEESKRKMTNSRMGKKRGKYKEGTGANISAAVAGLLMYNNGKIQRRFKEDPGELWVRGKLSASPTKGKRWFTNGTDSKVCIDCPEGWWKGRKFN